MVSTLPFQPVIIVGAGRSGTNMLRDAMCRLPYFETWDCDEINPIWRHGNIAYPNDEFSPEMATRPVNHFIRNRFLKEWKRSGQPQFLLEKTCANSLRVGFVDKVLPEAKYIFLVRNGLDVVASAQKRWRGDMEVESLPYYWSKVRNTPIFDLPIYGLRFLQARISMVLGTKDHMSFWGPKFSELTKLPPSMPLEELCALQWQACIENSLRDFALMDGQKHLTLRYEDFVSSPEQQLGKILDFLEVNGSSEDIARAVKSVSSKSIGKGRKTLTDEHQGIAKMVASVMSRFDIQMEVD